MDAGGFESIESDPNEAMTALCRSVMLYQSLLERCVARQPELVEEFTDRDLQAVKIADATILHWREYLEITD